MNINKSNKIIGYAIVAMILLPAFNYYVSNILTFRLGLSTITPFVYAFVLIFGVYACIVAKQKNLCRSIIYMLAGILVFMTLFSYTIYGNVIGEVLISSDFNPLYSQALYLILFCIPAIILGNSCRNWDIVLSGLTVCSPFVIAIAFAAYFFAGFSVYGEGAMDYMSISYYVLTAGCICFYNVLYKMSLIHLPFALLALFIIFAAGCRGALLCIFVFFAIYIYRQIRVIPNAKSTKILKIFLIVLCLSVLLGTTVNIELISDWFEVLGINSRSVTMLSDSTFLEDDARDGIRGVLWEHIIDFPIGYGLFGDRYITGVYSAGVEYAHNIFYELWSEFGILLGSFVAVWLILSIARNYLIRSSESKFTVLVILIPYGFIRLFFSGTYLNDVEFFVLLGILLQNKKNNGFKNKQDCNSLCCI